MKSFAALPIKRAMPALGLAVAIGLLVAHAHHFDFINDDAFISFRYADNLVQHGELTYNIGERVEGYTNFLWTMIIAAVLALGGDPVPWSKALGVLLSAGTLATVFFFSRWWATPAAGEAPQRSGMWCAAAPLFLAMSSAFAAWSEGGLETSLFTFLITAGLVRTVVEVAEDERTPLSAVCFALAAMTRPDGLLIAALAGLFRLGESCFRRKSPLPARGDIAWGVIFLSIFAPYWLWRYSYYGFVFPNTYYAKGDGALWAPGLRYLSGFVWDCHIWLIAALALLPLKSPRGRGWVLKGLAAWVSLPFMTYVARVGGDFMALYRFLVPLLPILALVGQESLASLWSAARRDLGPPSARSRYQAGVAALALLLLLGWHGSKTSQAALEVGSDKGVDSIGWLKQFVEQTTAIGRYVAAAYPPETTVATTAAGVIPYHSRMRTLDLLALNDVHTAHNVPSSGKRPGHSKSAPESYVLQWRPDLLIRHPRISQRIPRPSPSEVRYWRARGYKFTYAQIPGMEPPYWGYFEGVE